jgi:hypothetical protein
MCSGVPALPAHTRVWSLPVDGPYQILRHVTNHLDRNKTFDLIFETSLYTFMELPNIGVGSVGRSVGPQRHMAVDR